MEIDPELNYCPQCDDEYRAEIERCAVCEVALISGRDRLAREEQRRLRLANRAGALRAGDDLVNIHRGDLSEIKHMQALLDSEGIATLAAGDDSSCGKGCCSVFFLQVRRAEAQDALEIIGADFRRRTGLVFHEVSYTDAVFDPAAAEAVCPACGHRFATNSSTCPDCGLCLA